MTSEPELTSLRLGVLIDLELGFGFLLSGIEKKVRFYGLVLGFQKLKIIIYSSSICPQC